MKVSNSPIPKEDWDDFKAFLPYVPSFRFTANPIHYIDKGEYRIEYTIEAEDELKLSRHLNSLREARDKKELERYKSLGFFGKIRYKLALRRERLKKERRDASRWDNKYWRQKDWWGKDYTY